MRHFGKDTGFGKLNLVGYLKVGEIWNLIGEGDKIMMQKIKMPFAS